MRPLLLILLAVPFLVLGLLGVPLIWTLEEVLPDTSLRFALWLSAAVGMVLLILAYRSWRGGD